MIARKLLLVAAFWWGISAAVFAAGPYYEVKYEASTAEGELQMPVTYTVWLPPEVQTLRGVIVHQHGCGKGACEGGATAAYDLHWQELARRYECALLGPSYGQEEKQNCRLWCDPRNGSDKTFLRALDDLAKESKHPELATVPWCLWGHSGGGFWASIMMTLHPERTVAVWCRSGTAFIPWEKGEIAKPNLTPAVYEIPVMCNPGLKERDDKRFAGAWNGCLEMFRAYRKAGAPIGFAPDPRTGHECGDSRYLAIPWFAACLELRLPKQNVRDLLLREITAEKKFETKFTAEQTKPGGKYEGLAEEVIWQPSEAVATAWAQYVETGATEDTTPPPAPTNVSKFTTRKELTKPRHALLHWDATIDFESGLAGFVIYRDGEVLAKIPQKPVGKFGRPLYQPMTYHDTPELKSTELSIKDEKVGPGEKLVFGHWSYVDQDVKGTPKYQVKAVNSVGLESELSKPAHEENHQ